MADIRLYDLQKALEMFAAMVHNKFRNIAPRCEEDQLRHPVDANG